MSHRGSYKTKLCHLFARGRCDRDYCTFAHGEDELRQSRTSGGNYSSSTYARYDQSPDRHGRKQFSPPSRKRGRSMSPERSPDASSSHSYASRSPSPSGGSEGRFKERGPRQMRLTSLDYSADKATAAEWAELEDERRTLLKDAAAKQEHFETLQTLLHRKRELAEELSAHACLLEKEILDKSNEVTRVTLQLKKLLKSQQRVYDSKDDLAQLQSELQTLLAGAKLEDLDDNIISLVALGQDPFMTTGIEHHSQGVLKSEALPGTSGAKSTATLDGQRAKSTFVRPRVEADVGKTTSAAGGRHTASDLANHGSPLQPSLGTVATPTFRMDSKKGTHDKTSPADETQKLRGSFPRDQTDGQLSRDESGPGAVRSKEDLTSVADAKATPRGMRTSFRDGSSAQKSNWGHLAESPKPAASKAEQGAENSSRPPEGAELQKELPGRKNIRARSRWRTSPEDDWGATLEKGSKDDSRMQQSRPEYSPSRAEHSFKDEKLKHNSSEFRHERRTKHNREEEYGDDYDGAHLSKTRRSKSRADHPHYSPRIRPSPEEEDENGQHRGRNSSHQFEQSRYSRNTRRSPKKGNRSRAGSGRGGRDIAEDMEEEQLAMSQAPNQAPPLTEAKPSRPAFLMQPTAKGTRKGQQSMLKKHQQQVQEQLNQTLQARREDDLRRVRMLNRVSETGPEGTPDGSESGKDEEQKAFGEQSKELLKSEKLKSVKRDTKIIIGHGRIVQPHSVIKVQQQGQDVQQAQHDITGETASVLINAAGNPNVEGSQNVQAAVTEYCDPGRVAAAADPAAGLSEGKGPSGGGYGQVSVVSSTNPVGEQTEPADTVGAEAGGVVLTGGSAAGTEQQVQGSLEYTYHFKLEDRAPADPVAFQYHAAAADAFMQAPYDQSSYGNIDQQAYMMHYPSQYPSDPAYMQQDVNMAGLGYVYEDAGGGDGVTMPLGKQDSEPQPPGMDNDDGPPGEEREATARGSMDVFGEVEVSCGEALHYSTEFYHSCCLSVTPFDIAAETGLPHPLSKVSPVW